MTAVQQAEDELGDTGRILLRPSGTEQMIRVMVEADDEHVAHRLGRPRRRHGARHPLKAEPSARPVASNPLWHNETRSSTLQQCMPSRTDLTTQHISSTARCAPTSAGWPSTGRPPGAHTSVRAMHCGLRCIGSAASLPSGRGPAWRSRPRCGPVRPLRRRRPTRRRADRLSMRAGDDAERSDEKERRK